MATDRFVDLLFIDTFQVRSLLFSLLISFIAVMIEWKVSFADQRGDLLHSAANHLFLRTFNVYFSITLTILVFDRIHELLLPWEGSLFPVAIPRWLKVAGGFLMIDLSIWAYHWLTHRLSFLWRFHRVHHSDEQVSSTTAFRFHPGETIFSMGLLLPLMTLAGVPEESSIAYLFAQPAVTLFHHSQIRLPGRLSSILSWILVTPDLHHLHHSKNMKESNSNYGVIFTWWDRIFGTLIRKKSAVLNYGVDGVEGKSWKTLRGILKMPFGAYR